MLSKLIYFTASKSHFCLFDKETNYNPLEILQKYLMRSVKGGRCLFPMCTWGQSVIYK